MSKFNVGDIVEFIPEKVETDVALEYKRHCTGLFRVIGTTGTRIQMKAVDRKSEIDAMYCSEDCFREASIINFEMTASDLNNLLSDEK